VGDLKGSLLAGKRILVTSGPTRAPIDAVRYIINKSSGRLGAEIAKAALAQGAEVTIIYGKGSVLPLAVGRKKKRTQLNLREIETVEDLMRILEQELKNKKYDVLLHCMAVLDYVPEEHWEGKISSQKRRLTLRLKRTPKVIERIKDWDPQVYLVGFKLESGVSLEELKRRAVDSLIRSRADLIVANDLRSIEQGRHKAFIINREGRIERVEEGKEEIARGLVKLLGVKLKERKKNVEREDNLSRSYRGNSSL